MPNAHATPVTGVPEFVRLGAWELEGQTFEIASRNKLDSRQVLPWFTVDGQIHVGVLERARPSRLLRGAPLVGLEAIGFDFSGVDETADLRAYGDAIFSARAGVEIDETALAIALPSTARSIGYLTELTLPILLRVKPPPSREIDVTWDGGHHKILFRPLDELLRLLDAPDAPPFGEELLTLLRVLAPPKTESATLSLEASAAGDALIAREKGSILTSERLAASLFEPGRQAPQRSSAVRTPGALTGEALRFLRIHRIEHEGRAFEIVTPQSGTSVTILPYVVANGVVYFLLWQETRIAAMERRVGQPLYDLPVPSRYANATGFFMPPEEARVAIDEPRALCTRLLARVLGPGVAVRHAARLGPGAEPANSLSSEVRHRLACALDPSSVGVLPEGAFFIAAPELARAVGDGLIKDPVIVSGLLRMSAELGIDPFARAREGDVAKRRVFLDRMTSGSLVQRRLQSYSSIEKEQLMAPTYARLMTLLQHEFGLRIVYPHVDKDRTFFKAAYRVFMAADRGEDRALQGLHFSHDAFHFALGNFAPPPPPDFDAWYASGAPAPADAEPHGKDWDVYSAALKHAENEATFFSFWTLYDEHLPLARHVGKLTYYEALRDLGIVDRAGAWAIYFDVVHNAVLPPKVSAHPVYAARKDIQDLFAYMLGFRDYHYKDIAIAWKFAVKEPYRGYSTRFGIYENDLDRYLAYVHGFSEKLAKTAPGLNPLLLACADVRVDLSLRVWDVMKALKLLRAASVTGGRPESERRAYLAMAEDFMRDLEARKDELSALRSQVADAEMTPKNEAIHTRIDALGLRVEAVRHALWNRVGKIGILADSVLDEERTRELPR